MEKRGRGKNGGASPSLPVTLAVTMGSGSTPAARGYGGTAALLGVGERGWRASEGGVAKGSGLVRLL
jgi:hypothetical protein